MRVNIGFPVVRTDGRSAVGGRRSVYGHVITKFSGMGTFTKLWGSAHARASRARGAPLQGFYKVKLVSLFRFSVFLQCEMIPSLFDLQGFHIIFTGS